MPHVLEKVERRLGEKLFLKGERCLGPKCAVVRRAYPPGAHGKKSGRRRTASDFSKLLTEKQKIRFLYGLDDRDVERYSREASLKKGIFRETFLSLLERRLDNTVFRLGFAESRSAGRQIVGHGHVLLNGRAITIPSCRVREGDAIGFTERAWRLGIAAGFEQRIKKYEPPAWLRWNAEKRVGEVVRLPHEEDAGVTLDPVKVKEFYSR